MSSHRERFHPSDQPISIKLFQPNEVEEAAQTLRQFFESWYKPEVCIKERDSSPQTIGDYEVALKWWERLTSNPPLSNITRDTLNEFRVALRTATHRRGMFETSARYPLSKPRQITILRNIRAVVFRTGPDSDPKRPAASIVPKAAHVTIEKVEAHPKPAISLARVRKIAAVAVDMTWPEIKGVAPGQWCLAVVCGLFYTGLRVGTLLRLEWSMLQEHEDGWWLHTTERKTGKLARVAMHSDLVRALEPIRTTSRFVYSIDRYVTRKRRRVDTESPTFSVGRMGDLQEALQRLAGIPETQWVSPHGWRRTHLNQLDEVGYRRARMLLQSAADHDESSTTEGHYVDVKNKYRRLLPSILPKADDRQQRLF